MDSRGADDSLNADISTATEGLAEKDSLKDQEKAEKSETPEKSGFLQLTGGNVRRFGNSDDRPKGSDRLLIGHQRVWVMLFELRTIGD